MDSPSTENPYPGLRAFEAEDSRFFFGRDAEIRQLAHLVVAHRVVLLYAQSGAGKTSLLKAGVIPRLAAEESVVVLPITRVGGSLPPGLDGVKPHDLFVYNTLYGLMGKEGKAASLTGTSLLEGLKPYLQAADRDEPWSPRLLVLDQFEEIFTNYPERHRERADYFRALQTCLRELTQLKLLICMREDCIAELDPYTALLPDRLRTRFRMERLDRASALAAVRRPAETAGRPFEEGVAEALVDDLRRLQPTRHRTDVGETGPTPDGDEPMGKYVEPVHLQIVCRRLWEDLPPGGQTIRQADVESLGDVDEALTGWYRETLAAARRASDVSERRLRLWFDQEMITAAGTRRLIYRGEQETEGLTNAAVDVFDKKYVIRPVTRGGAIYYELAHDRLVMPLQKDNADWLKANQNVLQSQAALWQAEGGKSGLLLQDQALAEAEAWAEAHEAELEPHELAFLAACRQARDDAKRERRQSRLILVLALVAAAVALLALGAAFYAWDQSRIAEERTEIAVELLGGQARFLEQVEAQEVTDDMLLSQRQRLEKAASLLTGGTAPIVTLPDLQGTDYMDALQQLAQACEPQPCLRSLVRWETSGGAAFGSVIGLEPTVGTELLWGTPVTLIVSHGQELVLVPGGEFLMGSDPVKNPQASRNEQPQHTITLNEFYIGKHEVTNEQYAVFVEAAGHDVPDDWQGGHMPAGEEDHPVVNVSWDGAVAFTQWLSEETGSEFRLCTEAEWEKACRGTTDLIYPWDDTWDASKANTYETGIGTTTQVGSYSPQGDGPYGAADMSGNVWEWTSTGYADYPYDPKDGRENLAMSGSRVVRGGSFYTPAREARCALRDRNPPDNSFLSLGFRVCASPG